MKKLIPLMILLVLLVGCKENPVENTFYTVTFNTDGGSEVSQQTVLEGMTAVEPKDPTKVGYEFLRWTLDNETYDFNTPVTSNLELKAFYTSTKALNLLKNDARKIYDLANLFVNKTTLTDSVAGDIVIYANNLATGKAKLLINAPKDSNLITMYNEQTEYDSSQYDMKIETSSLEERSLETSEDGKTKTFKLESLSLKVKYTQKSTPSTITIKYADSVTEAATLKNVNIVLTEKTVDGTNYVEGSVQMEIETDQNQKQTFQMTFLEMEGALVSANYLGLNLTF